MLDPTPPVNAAPVLQLAGTDTADAGSELTALSIAIVNANRDVTIASIEDAGKTRRLILRFVLPLGVAVAGFVLGLDGVLLELLRFAKGNWDR